MASAIDKEVVDNHLKMSRKFPLLTPFLASDLEHGNIVVSQVLLTHTLVFLVQGGAIVSPQVFLKHKI